MKKREKTEAEIQRDIVAYLELTRLKGLYTISNASTNVSHHRGYKMKKGWPDISATHPDTGRSIYIEVKAPRGKLSPEQVAQRDRFLRAHAWFIEAHSVSDVSKALYGTGV